MLARPWPVAVVAPEKGIARLDTDVPQHSHISARPACPFPIAALRAVLPTCHHPLLSSPLVPRQLSSLLGTFVAFHLARLQRAAAAAAASAGAPSRCLSFAATGRNNCDPICMTFESVYKRHANSGYIPRRRVRISWTSCEREAVKEGSPETVRVTRG